MRLFTHTSKERLLRISPQTIILLIFLLIAHMSCKKSAPEGPVFLGTRVCLNTQHHERSLPGVEVYIKYGAVEFPGYENLSVYDTMLVSDQFGEVCFPVVPLGEHWFIGYGHDDLLDEPVRGSLPIEIISLHHPRDTVLYVSEY